LLPLLCPQFAAAVFVTAGWLLLLPIIFNYDVAVPVLKMLPLFVAAGCCFCFCHQRWIVVAVAAFVTTTCFCCLCRRRLVGATS